MTWVPFHSYSVVLSVAISAEMAMSRRPVRAEMIVDFPAVYSPTKATVSSPRARYSARSLFSASTIGRTEGSFSPRTPSARRPSSNLPAIAAARNSVIGYLLVDIITYESAGRI